jgi:hypothetical protein
MYFHGFLLCVFLIIKAGTTVQGRYAGITFRVRSDAKKLRTMSSVSMQPWKPARPMTPWTPATRTTLRLSATAGSRRIVLATHRISFDADSSHDHNPGRDHLS